MTSLKQIARRFIANNKLCGYLVGKSQNAFFPGSANYWERRYQKNGNSGVGSYGKNAAYKADFLNQFVVQNDIRSVIEFGCGDGNQLMQFHFPEYIGLDVSNTAIQKCKSIFKGDVSKRFFLYDSENRNLRAQLTISLDVVFHLVEDEVFRLYMNSLFAASSAFVIIYAWDVEGEKKYHVRHRNFSKWIQKNIPHFGLLQTIKGTEKGSFCDFFIYQKKVVE